MRSHSNNNLERKANQNTEEQSDGDYFCACVDDFECDECFVEAALCAAFDDAGLVVWVV
jgi:hypothetical protein